MRVTELNHVAITVADVDRSIDFYVRILGLEKLPRPAFDFPGAWFRLGKSQELHLIGPREEKAYVGSRGNHFALMVDDIDAWDAQLTREAAQFVPKKVRPDGAYQIFVEDPDGHFIELCTSPGDVS